MSKRSQDKRRARAKEKAKAARRERGASPLSRLAGDGSNIECWMHRVAEDARIVNLIVFRPVRDGSFAAAFFLIDYDCIGLKDAFHRFDTMPTDVISNLRAQSREDGSQLVKITGDETRRLIAAAARWTRDHRFRLSNRWEKCTRILGGAIDMNAADTTGFGTADGGLLYVGRHKDLEHLLLDETLDEFLARKDVECQFVEEVPGLQEDDTERESEGNDNEENSDPQH
jgi:hypothetical protein